ncbi:UDP-N-acetylmuramoyl-tripeptide--D-alanyl-D-alanine ligase [Jonesia quinghaiensis]|uniref:UDP-N-acetylmuramoyl-tripeptide--D-alanyl-D- alanine ligase n=1 Tax=Jonesia quinghaiensis TaxID=262806 RepID=UPI000422BFB9|nr:UDP-N-acetylmuramoyl-tripeptide--D-alanyl-D-alanine ligase [Jonesia quinghaiensis]
MFTAQEIADITGGELHCSPEVVVSGAVTIDSRAAGEGSLFAAVIGENNDGHDYAAAAIAAGAALVLAQQPLSDVPYVLVVDTQKALGDLAREHLKRLRAARPVKVIGITGSAGKTTTKDLIGQILSMYGSTVVPAGSFNNELGLPLTVLSATSQTEYLVAEMGASAPQDLTYLTDIAPLDVAVVLIVGRAHLGGFGSVEAVAQAKGELVEGLVPGGIAVLNADDHRVIDMRHRTQGRVMTFGAVRDTDIQAVDTATDVLGRPSFAVVTPEGRRAQVTLTLVGEHHVTNALAALSAVTAVGIDLEEAAQHLSNATVLSPHRMDVVDRADGITVIDDSYNANPDSMRAALRALAMVAGRSRRTVAVLGEMRELGPESRQHHDEIGRLVVRLNVSLLVVVGAGAQGIADGAMQEGSWGDEVAEVATIDDARVYLQNALIPGDVVLVKASHGSGLWRLADELTGKASRS